MYEVNRPRRGHDFLPTPDRLLTVPAIYTQETVDTVDKVVHLHYFAAAGDWWITELDPQTLLAFGYVRLAAMPECAEWGYIPLDELEAAIDGLGCPVERDLHWQPTAFGQIPDAR
ncbi:hypothetical protein GCM10009661_56750 [Catellatospora chokoriensis]|uniref:DUF2958 domain-containing protein n=1 Tax=Catellatospora chokoriensis TaxID=310353 RepID=A0A8J3K8J2_9ACTN|nr:hypothetical protein Cch02nite_39180 [Catellatospora chokoriensis]